MTDIASVDWSRAQFALTALYHFIFVPLTLGLSFMVAFMETLYVKTGNEEWKKITKFWLRLFAINFAIGVATGIIMEFEFGTNWANYSWFVGDIFGAPLAVEGILAFFMEATFFAVMFFGWDKVSKKFHLVSTWLVAIGSNLSALWILIANGWMQSPVGTVFNPITARNEMTNFFEVALSPVAISKFIHTVGGGYVTSSFFVLAVSAWFLLRNRHINLAKKSFVVAAVFGIISSLFVGFSGDESAYQVAQKQPMKLAAMEGLYTGEKNAAISVGILNPDKTVKDNKNPYLFSVSLPYGLGLMATRGLDNYTPGINDLVYGNKQENIESVASKMEKGKIAVQSLADFKKAKDANDKEGMNKAESILKTNMQYFGYGYIDNPEKVVPPVKTVFYSFHIMVIIGVYALILFIVALCIATRKNLLEHRTLLKVSLWSLPVGLIASELGWMVAELGRQPWAIQDLMPVGLAATNLSSVNVQISFILFAILFTVLFIAEIRIMLKQIKIGF